MAGFPLEFQASRFRGSPEFLQPMPTCVKEVLPGTHWWNVPLAQTILVLNLCSCGLDEEALVQQLQPFSQGQAVTFVCQLIDVTAEWCREELLQQMDLLNSPAAKEQEKENSTVATPGPATSSVTIPDPSPRAQEEPHEELGQEVAKPSSAGQDRDYSRPRHPSKRKASGPRASSAPRKRLC